MFSSVDRESVDFMKPEQSLSVLTVEGSVIQLCYSLYSWEYDRYSGEISFVETVKTCYSV